MPDYIDQVFGPGGVLAKRFPSYEMRTGQVALARLVDAAMREGHHAMGEGPCGCHVAGQQILLSNGRTLAVEHIQVGHQLMGPDGTPRTVLALARGSQETVQIQPSNGAPWRVNLDHILTLIRTTNDSIVDVRVRDWLAWSPSQKAQYALFRAITPQFPLKDLQRTSFHAIPTGLVEPYFGFSLDGDGRYLLGDFTVTHNTGKSVAYSVPAIWHARHRDKRVLICTANIALQEQLVNTDLPMLAEVLPWTFSFALVKGRSNFLCHDRLAELEFQTGSLFDDEEARQMRAVLLWAERTSTGDISELSFVPAPAVWRRVSVTSDECRGEDCPFQESCFADAARARAENVDLVVTNYHMLFAHLAVRHSTGANLVLPGFDLLVLDEAHEAPSISRDFFGFAVSEHTLTRLAAAAASMGNVPLATVLRQEAAGLFRQLAAHRGEEATAALPAPSGDAKPVLDALERLRRHALTWADAVRGDRRALGTARMTVRHATTAAERLAAALEQPSPDKVTWLEADAKGRTVLLSKPADVSPTLRSLLFGSCESVSLVSATLTTAGTFDFFRRQVGAPDHVRELVAETPFRFREQALLVVPQGAPDPNTPEYLHHLARVFDDVLEACGGRTLGLFTSYRALHAIRDHLAKSPWRVLCQGDAPRTELVREFRQDVRSVLLGTESFWTGIDVAGEALTAVVIDKLPFPSPADPLIAALGQRDPRAFDTTLVPLAIIALRQGVGRLIRSKTDVGVVVIVDPRLADRRYGRRFLRSLPAMYSTRDLKNIRPFLEETTRARRD